MDDLFKNRHVIEDYTESISKAQDTNNPQDVFNIIAQLIYERQEDEAIAVIAARQDLWRPGLFLEARDEDGNNILHLACINHCDEIIAYLITNQFPDKILNKEGKSVYTIQCLNGPECKECAERINHLPQKTAKLISRLSIANSGGNLLFQAVIAAHDGMDEDNTEKLVGELIDNHLFIEAQNVVLGIKKTIDLTYALTTSIIKWKQYPKNDYIKDLLQALISKEADKILMDDHIQELFGEDEDLKRQYYQLIENRNNPLAMYKSQVIEKNNDLPAPSKSRHNKRFHSLPSTPKKPSKRQERSHLHKQTKPATLPQPSADVTAHVQPIINQPIEPQTQSPQVDSGITSSQPKRISSVTTEPQKVQSHVGKKIVVMGSLAALAGLGIYIVYNNKSLSKTKLQDQLNKSLKNYNFHKLLKKP